MPRPAAVASSSRRRRSRLRSASGSRVLEPEALEPGLDLGAPGRRRGRVRAHRPRRGARGAAVAQRAPVAPAPLARRGAGRARAHGRRRGDRRHDHQAREGARRGSDRRAGAIRDSLRRRRRELSTRKRRGQRRDAARRVLADRGSRRFTSRRASRRTRPRSPKRIASLDLARPASELVNHVRALSPHIGARAELHGRGVTIWRARVGDDGSFEPLEVQPDGSRRMTYEEWLRGLRP